VEWAVGQGIETATFHILTPYPGTVTFQQMEAQGRILHRDWDLYDTRHVVFRPARLRAEALEAGYWRAYRDFYRWGNIARGAATKPTMAGAVRHAAYAAGWKKFEPLWDWLIRARRVGRALPLLETVLEHVHVEAEGVGLSQGGHATGSLSAGRGMSATLLALRYRTSPAISTLPLTSSQRELSPR
jgi:hypothetical protein